MEITWNPLKWFRSHSEVIENKAPDKDTSSIPPGRVSVPDDSSQGLVVSLRDITNLVTPSFRSNIIPLIRDLYKVNPDMSIAIQDMFKLSNTGHTISFPNNTPEEAKKMKEHLSMVSKRWSNYTAGINGLVNRFIVQCLTSGAISIEAVPNNKLDGISTIVFVNPENIYFRRLENGVYHPYQKNPYTILNDRPDFIKLNTETYIYVGMYNDTDEPYGVPPFMAALDSIKGQHDMRINFKHIMELMGMVGFLEAKMEKPPREPNESVQAYRARLNNTLVKLKKNMMGGLKDGIVTGYKEDHEFKLNSTTQSLQNLEKPWAMNQQSVANGLGINSNIIGVQTSNTEGGAGILLSKMISQLKNIQMLVSHILEFIYTLELRLSGFNNKGIKVEFGTSTISDELKVQQGLEYKIRNLQALYNQGIINQQQYAWAMGYEKPDQKEPRQINNDISDIEDSAKKQKREADKDKSDRKTRDKNNPMPKRKDQDTKTR
jgi:hypothetical protein|nr:MAG TPA: portal [Caudoviricetes sp.]